MERIEVDHDSIFDNAKLFRGAQSLSVEPGPLIRHSSSSRFLSWTFADLVSGTGIGANVETEKKAEGERETQVSYVYSQPISILTLEIATPTLQSLYWFR